MGIAGVFGVGIVVVLVVAGFISDFNSNSNSNSNSGASEDERQLNGLDDGLGGVFVNGEYMTRQEAKDAQSRGELYDTFL